MISKGLLGEVLGFKVETIEPKKGVDLDYYDIESTYIQALGVKQDGYGSFNVYDGVVNINIYELAHKCKEWVFKTTEYSFSSGISRTIHAACKNKIGDGVVMLGGKFFFADSEPEAIFKACQWILDNKDKQ